VTGAAQPKPMCERFWTLPHEDCTPTHDYEPTREAAVGSVGEELAAGMTGSFRPASWTCRPVHGWLRMR
jgi:hypothetical protein